MVCMGNICRSPLAEAVSRAMAEEQGMAAMVEFDSAGTHGAHAGEAPDERACRVAQARGYKMNGLRARKVVVDDFQRFDLVLAMDRANLATLKRMCPESYQPKLRLFLEFADQVDADEVPDPYYGNMAGFERVVALCEQAARGLISAIRRGAVSR